MSNFLRCLLNIPITALVGRLSFHGVSKCVWRDDGYGGLGIFCKPIVLWITQQILFCQHGMWCSLRLGSFLAPLEVRWKGLIVSKSFWWLAGLFIFVDHSANIVLPAWYVMLFEAWILLGFLRSWMKRFDSFQVILLACRILYICGSLGKYYFASMVCDALWGLDPSWLP